MALPRTSTKEIHYNNAIFPAGTTFYMNALAADHDPVHYQSPSSFLPERHLSNAEGAGLPHFAYGAGGRMCVGWQLANRQLYTVFLRTILAFEIGPAGSWKGGVGD